jgi:type IV pilus assembly protein PilF
MRYLAMLLTGLLLTACAGGGGSRNGELAIKQTTNPAASANLNLGIEYMRAGNMELALERLKRALDADPGYYGTHNALGLLYQRLGENGLAERHFKRSIALNGTDSGSKNNYGLFLCQNNRFAEAEKIFLAAVANPLYETPEVAYTNAGTCALMNKQVEAAENYFRQALSINAELPSALIQMAQISYDRDNYLNARGYLQRYQSVAKHTAASLMLGIKIEKELGDRNAVASYELLLKNNFGDSVEAGQLNSPARN